MTSPAAALMDLHYRAAANDRLWSKIDDGDDANPDYCWLWTGATVRGYPRFFYRGRMQSAHRLMYEWHNGPILPGQLVRHRCEMRSCVRPEHLYIEGVDDA